MSDDLPRVPGPVLIADIGGTNARFALAGEADDGIVRFPDEQGASFPTVDDAIARALDHSGARPRSAVLALAGPIQGDAVAMTNSPWVIEPKRLIKRFGFEEVILLNDFEALSLSLADLTGGDLDFIGKGSAEPMRPRVVLGPGTGLGAAALIHARGIWIPVPGEGGHIDLAPVTDRDFAIWPHVEKPGPGSISGEALLSGSGLVRLYRAVAAANGVKAVLTTPPDIAKAGLDGSDATAKETLDLFAAYLGRLAGDLALVFVATGGVYLAGGITGHIAPALKSGHFREAFVDKFPHRPLLEGIGTAIITKPDAALAGIAAFARQPARFGVEPTGRLWRA
jgi:glucokinase